ncbi:MAG TPA: hypothetical protein VN961_20795, partial [Streptosporangiaceae bacterium]|nr:hypothetical protein [Streptosporangiaceae bacterium]
PGGDQQLSFAGMNRIGHAGPAPATPVAGRPAPAAPDAGTQLQLAMMVYTQKKTQYSAPDRSARR